MIYIGIDPGNKQTAIVSIDDVLNVCDHMKLDNELIRSALVDMMNGPAHLYTVGIECVACYGMAVGAEVFETAEWCGRIRGMLRPHQVSPLNIYRVYRKQVKMHLCGSTKAKDANIRQALIDRYEPTGGGKCGQIGSKAQPGPLYGFAKDKWAALAVAITTKENKDSLNLYK